MGCFVCSVDDFDDRQTAVILDCALLYDIALDEATTHHHIPDPLARAPVIRERIEELTVIEKATLDQELAEANRGEDATLE
jgi:hypothetical protein